MRRSRSAACALLLVVGCAGRPEVCPRPASVEPAVGYGAAPVAVVIRGDGFYVAPSQSTAGDRTVSARHRAWLGAA
jgi:hypothetical protein